MKNTSKRREDILSKLKVAGSVIVSELASEYDVSTVTIRNDLAYLEKNGALLRAYGGAISKQNLVSESSVEVKNTLHAQQKLAIAKMASSFIRDGESIILDSGTTTERIADYLGDKSDIIAMTNGLNVAQKLLNQSSVELMMTGGSLRRKSLSFYGAQAEENLKAYHFDKLFLGVDGFHLDRGITTHNENEARLNRIMSKIANEIIVVTDSSKFGKIGLHKILMSQSITMLITDSGIPNEYRDGLVQQGIQVITVD